MAEEHRRKAKALLLAMGFSRDSIQENYKVSLSTGNILVTMVGISDSSRQAVQCEELDVLKLVQLKKLFDKVWEV